MSGHVLGQPLFALKLPLHVWGSGCYLIHAGFHPDSYVSGEIQALGEYDRSLCPQWSLGTELLVR